MHYDVSWYSIVASINHSFFLYGTDVERVLNSPSTSATERREILKKDDDLPTNNEKFT